MSIAALKSRQTTTPKTARPVHVCQYRRPCKACAVSGARLSLEVQATLRKSLERTRNFRAQEHIESIRLPARFAGADGYGPNGEPRYFSRKAYKEAGRKFGLEWQ